MCVVNIKIKVYKKLFFIYNKSMKKLKAVHFEILKEKRLKLGLSQTVMAKKIGVSQQHWDRYEKGHPIPLEKILRISQQLNISKWDLLPVEFSPENQQNFNKDLLKSIFISIENLIIEKKLHFSPENKAKLLILLYEKFSKNPKNDNIQQNILSTLINAHLDKSA